MKQTMLMICTLPLLLAVAGCEKHSSTTSTSTTSTSTEPVPVRPPDGTNASAPAAADNTARNAQDRNNATLTPLDQGSAPADVELSQRIRKALVNGPAEYSVAAKNVKVITVNGKVTLRGPVQTDAEKIAVASLARSVAGEGNVDDQLEVKTNPQP